MILRGGPLEVPGGGGRVTIPKKIPAREIFPKNIRASSTPSKAVHPPHGKNIPAADLN